MLSAWLPAVLECSLHGALGCYRGVELVKQEGALKYPQALGMSHLVLVGQDQEMAVWMEASSSGLLHAYPSSLSSSLLACLCVPLIQVSA